LNDGRTCAIWDHGKSGWICAGYRSCGDTMEVFLKFKNDRVQDASFQTDGCGNSAVCGSFAAEMAIGKTPDEMIEITGESILEFLGGFPKEDRHCAFLAAETLQEALNDYMIKQRENRQRRALMIISIASGKGGDGKDHHRHQSGCFRWIRRFSSWTAMWKSPMPTSSFGLKWKKPVL
jgi:hypothetical protein